MTTRNVSRLGQMPAGGQIAPLRTAELESMGSWLTAHCLHNFHGGADPDFGHQGVFQNCRFPGPARTSQAALTGSFRKLFRSPCLSP